MYGYWLQVRQCQHVSAIPPAGIGKNASTTLLAQVCSPLHTVSLVHHLDLLGSIVALRKAATTRLLSLQRESSWVLSAYSACKRKLSQWSQHNKSCSGLRWSTDGGSHGTRCSAASFSSGGAAAYNLTGAVHSTCRVNIAQVGPRHQRSFDST